MIPRYTPKAMADLWSDNARWQRWLEVELAVTETLAEDGLVPKDAAIRMRKNARFDGQAIDRYEAVSRHDVIAFTQSVGDFLGPDKRFLHLGLTSYDVVDTALSMALVEAGKSILTKLAELRSALADQAEKHKLTLMPGRTHGVHAEPSPSAGCSADISPSATERKRGWRARSRRFASGSFQEPWGHIPPSHRNRSSGS